MQRFLIAILIILSTSLNYAASPIAIVVSPLFGLAPFNTRAKITILPNADNRFACLTVDGPEYRQHCWEHIGLNAPKTIWETKTLERLPGGVYIVTATVTLKSGKQISVSSTVCSIGTEGNPCLPDI